MVPKVLVPVVKGAVATTVRMSINRMANEV